jgi:hypothetical protein
LIAAFKCRISVRHFLHHSFGNHAIFTTFCILFDISVEIEVVNDWNPKDAAAKKCQLVMGSLFSRCCALCDRSAPRDVQLSESSDAKKSLHFVNPEPSHDITPS